MFFVLLLGSALVYTWVSVIAPQLTALPSGYTYSADVVSYDDFFDEKAGAFSGPVRSDTKFGYKVVRSEGQLRIVENTFDVRKPTGEKIITINREYGIDAQTEKHVAGYGDKNRTGYLFGPRSAGAQEFTYWHVNYDVPITMKFAANETVAGVQTARYEARFSADQTNSLTNLPDVGKTRGVSTDVTLQLWVEPVSGHLVKYDDQATAYYYDLATKTRLNPWNKFSNTFSFNAIATHARIAEQERQHIQLVSIGAPLVIAFLTLSIIFVIALRRYKDQGVARLSAAAAVFLATASLVFWYTVGLRIGLPEWIEPMYPGASIGIILLAVRFFMSSKKPATIHVYSVTLLVAVGLFGALAADRLIDSIHLGFTVPVVGGQEPFILPIAAAAIAAYALTMLLRPLPKNRVTAYLRELLAAGAIAVALFSTIGYAYGDVESLIRLSAAIALVLIGIGIFANEDDWLISKQMRRLGKGAWLFALIAVGMLVITGLAWQAARSSANQQAELQFQSDVNTMQNAISDRLRIYTNALYGAQSLFAASDNVSRSEWKSYVDGLKIAENYPGVQGIGFAQIVPRSQLAAHTESIRKQGFPSYAVRPLEPTRDTYSSIIYLEPFDERNQRAFGFDMLSEPTRRAALERARDTGEAAMTGRVTLLQETNEDVQYGFLVYVPVFKKSVPLTTADDRRAALLGYVYSPFRMNNFMQAIMGNLANGIDLEVFDSATSKLTDETKMFSSSQAIDRQSKFVETQPITAAGHTWSVRFTGSSDYSSSLNQSLPDVVLVGGILLSFTLAVAVFGLSSSRQRAVSYAESLTKDLAAERDSALKVQDKDEAILGGMAEGLMVLNRDGKIEKVNQAALLLLGYADAAELVNKELSTTIRALGEDGKPLPAKQRPATKVLQSGVALPNAKVQYERKDGTRFWALISVAPITHKGRITGAIELFRDVTAERELDKAKDEFLSVASHQLRTPITAERWYLDILQDGSTVGKLSKEQQDIARKISESNIRMSELVAALLNVSRAESGRLAIQPVPTDVSKLVKSVIDELAMRFSKKQQQIVQDIAKTPVINVDPTLVSQIVVNLLTNASKYSPEKTRIFVSLAKQGEYLACTVRDEGYGIPAEQQNRLFTKFFRADNAVKLEADGNGLGLYLVKTIVELSGGTISFESKESLGTTFRFTLPLAGSRGREGVVKLEEKKG